MRVYVRSEEDNKRLEDIKTAPKPVVKKAKNNKLIIQSYWLKQKYNLTLFEYEQLLIKQNYACAICKNPETKLHNKTKQIQMLAVDHCHTTGKVRELLCSSCNLALGYLKDNSEIGYAAANYLRKHRK